MLTLFGCPVNRSAGLANAPNAYAIVSEQVEAKEERAKPGRRTAKRCEGEPLNGSWQHDRASSPIKIECPKLKV